MCAFSFLVQVAKALFDSFFLFDERTRHGMQSPVRLLGLYLVEKMEATATLRISLAAAPYTFQSLSMVQCLAWETCT